MFLDMIANLNGMYHVMALNPDLLYSKEQCGGSSLVG